MSKTEDKKLKVQHTGKKKTTEVPGASDTSGSIDDINKGINFKKTLKSGGKLYQLRSCQSVILDIAPSIPGVMDQLRRLYISPTNLPRHLSIWEQSPDGFLSRVY